jgi:hypothetical protein
MKKAREPVTLSNEIWGNNEIWSKGKVFWGGILSRVLYLRVYFKIVFKIFLHFPKVEI